MSITMLLEMASDAMKERIALGARGNGLTCGRMYAGTCSIDGRSGRRSWRGASSARRTEHRRRSELALRECMGRRTVCAGELPSGR